MKVSLVERAIDVALQAHYGQLDEFGEPYILHPLRVMQHFDTDVTRSIAVMKDVITGAIKQGRSTQEAIYSKMYTMPAVVVDGVEELTYPQDKSYFDYIASLKSASPICRMATLSVHDNLNEKRMSRLDPKQAGKLRERYLRALQILTE